MVLHRVTVIVIPPPRDDHVDFPQFPVTARARDHVDFPQFPVTARARDHVDFSQFPVTARARDLVILPHLAVLVERPLVL
jgi:hypothetical protein